jgi:hypothetical protein
MAVYTGWDTSTGKDIFRKLVREIFDSTARTAILESLKLYKDGGEKTDKWFERLMRFAGMPRGTTLAEGGKIPIYEPKFGQTLDIYQKEFSQGFRVSWMMKKTNQWDMVKRWTTNLRLNQAELKDVELAKLWNSPTSTYTGFDSQVLAYASHTCLDDAATTYSNIGSGGLSLAALEAAELYFDTLVDDQGQLFYVDTKGMLLAFAPALKVTVNEILRSTGKPHEISNTMNYWEDRFTPYVYRRLTSTTACFLLATGDRRYDVHCYTLSEPDLFEKDTADTTMDSQVLAHQSFGWGFGDPRLAYCLST